MASLMGLLVVDGSIEVGSDFDLGRTNVSCIVIG
jgi:hypothetical protein